MTDLKNKTEAVEQTFLRVEASDGVTHLLPFGHLLNASLSREEGEDGTTEKLRIRFAINAVEVSGSGLSIYLDGIQSMTLKSILPKAKPPASIESILVIDTSDDDG